VVFVNIDFQCFDPTVNCLSSRWDFIQGESALYRHIATKTAGSGGLKRRIQKKIISTKQKLEELDSVASGFANQMVRKCIHLKLSKYKKFLN
jgi:tRNA U38,U39,U40 pseudouridine synthase TruA